MQNRVKPIYMNVGFTRFYIRTFINHTRHMPAPLFIPLNQ